MAKAGVLLIHGLGGTQYDLGSMHKRLKNAGFDTHALTLPGHGSKPEDLTAVQVEDWLEAVRVKYREVLNKYDVLHVMGMCMGALLAVETVKRECHTKGSLVALAPPVFIDGWATPWYRAMRHLLYRIPGVSARMRVGEEDPYGIKNEQLRSIVKAKLERGERFHYRWVPLACIREVDRLRAMVMKNLDAIACRTLVVHARDDELTSLRSAHYLTEGIGRGVRAGQARMVVLEDSYHMICVDNDREIVAKSVLEFFGAPLAGSLGMFAIDGGMTAAEMAALVELASADLLVGNFAALFAKGVPGFAWFQPGENRRSGRFAGVDGLGRLRALFSGVRFEAIGMPSFNTGMAVLPMTLRDGTLASQGVMALAMRGGKLVEARWFPDDVELEDRSWGAREREESDAVQVEFDAAVSASRTLTGVLDDDTMLTMYALYKQVTIGDATGTQRPSRIDVVGRAKYEAWLRQRGMPREEAMQAYARLVERLRSGTQAGGAGE